MTVDELKQLIAETREFYKKFPDMKPGVSLKVDRRCRGERCRVLPGVMGKIVQYNENSVITIVSLDDLERYVRKMEEHEDS